MGGYVFHFLTIVFFQKYCRLITGYAFENCDDSSTHHGNCTVVQRDGAIGSESVNSITLNGGYSDFGKKSGCPYEAGACEKGFSFYGWVKFFGYVTPCDNYGVYVSDQQFAIHLQGNGRLSVYVWMKNDTQWHAETVQPVQLGFWYPLILQFDYNRTLGNGTMILWLQSQQLAFSNCTEKRTFKPVVDNMVFGGDGATKGKFSFTELCHCNSQDSDIIAMEKVASVRDHFTNIQIDRTNWDSGMQNMEHIVGVLIDPPAREGGCRSKPYSTLTRPFQCFWLQRDERKNWTEAYKACDMPAYDAGYPYGRLARFQPENQSFTWRASEPKFREAVSGGQKLSYLAWLGGGRRSHWLNGAMTVAGDAIVPQDVGYNGANATDESCMALDTSGRKWQWVESDCSRKLGYVCEMSWDCVLQNPCQNFGACVPVTNGPMCKCYPGSTGNFCEHGVYEPYCLNNCSCSVERKICQAPTPVSETWIRLQSANECQKKLRQPLHDRLVKSDLMYNTTLEETLEEKFWPIFEEQENCSRMEIPYGSWNYKNSTWAAYLTYRLYAKINSGYVDALCSDINDKRTAVLINEYKRCNQTFQMAKSMSTFKDIKEKHGQKEKDQWRSILKDSE